MLMRKFGLWVLLWVGLLSFRAQGEELRVLMIGNSYTFYNRLPDALMALSRRTDCPLQVDSYTAGAMSLRGFLDSPEHAKARQMLGLRGIMTGWCCRIRARRPLISRRRR